MFTNPELYLLSVSQGWWILWRVGSKGFPIYSVYTPDLWPFCMKPCGWPRPSVPLSFGPVLALLPSFSHLIPTWSLGQAPPMPFKPETEEWGCSNVWTHTHYSHVKVLESLRTAGIDVQHFNCSIYIFVCPGNESKFHLIDTCKQTCQTLKGFWIFHL